MIRGVNRAKRQDGGSCFDAVLVIGFGGPRGPEDVRPFLENVVRGKPVPRGRLDEVARHYDLFGGASPLNPIMERQVAGLCRRLASRSIGLPVYLGMRNWHPFLAGTLTEMAQAGVRRAIGFIAAAHHCYSSCGQYKRDVLDARGKLIERGLPDVEMVYVPSWYDHEGFIAANAARIESALERMDRPMRERARIIFTAHSIPVSMAAASRYCEQLAVSARLVAQKLGRDDWALVYQSRSGRPQDPWLEPDVCDYLRAEHAKGLSAAVIAPIGFIVDHVEVLYDLDHRAAGVCRELGVLMVRAETVNDDDRFLDMMADVVQRTHDRYRSYPPLPIAAGG